MDWNIPLKGNQSRCNETQEAQASKKKKTMLSYDSDVKVWQK